MLCLIRMETEGLLDYEGRTGIICIVRWGTFARSYSVSSSAEGICENCWRISQRILMANLSDEFFVLVSPGFQAPPPPKKKIAP